MVADNRLIIRIAVFFALINLTLLNGSAGSANFVLASGKKVAPNKIATGTAAIANEVGEALKASSKEKERTLKEALRITVVRGLFNKKIDAVTYSKELQEQKRMREKLEIELAQTQKLLAESQQRVQAEKGYSLALNLKHKRQLERIKEAQCCCFLWTCCYPRYELD